MIGGGKVALQRKVLLKNLVVMKLCAVVEGDGLEVAPMCADRGKGGLGYGGSSSGVNLVNDGQSRFFFHQSKYAVVAICAHHGIPFPVAQLLAGLDMGRSHGNVTFPRQDSARIPRVIAFSTSFGHDAQVIE